MEMFKRVDDRDVLLIGTHFCDPSSGYVVRDGENWKLKVAG